MQRTLICTLAVLGTLVVGRPRVADGQTPNMPLHSSPSWYAGIATGYYFPIQQWPTAYRLGGGGTVFIGRSIAPAWSVQLDANQWLLSGSQRSTWDIKVGPTVKWMARTSGAMPFVLAGVGIDAQTNYPSRSSNSSAMVPVGIGLEGRSGSNGAVFVEAMHYFVLHRVETRDIPLLLGFRLGI